MWLSVCAYLTYIQNVFLILNFICSEINYVLFTMKLFQLKLCPKLWTDCTDPNIFQTRACYSNGQSCHIPPIFEPKKKWFFKYSCMYWASGFLLAVSFLCKCLSLRLPKYQSYNCTYLLQYISSIGFTHVLVAMPRVCLNILKELMGS